MPIVDVVAFWEQDGWEQDGYWYVGSADSEEMASSAVSHSSVAVTFYEDPREASFALYHFHGTCPPLSPPTFFPV